MPTEKFQLKSGAWVAYYGPSDTKPPVFDSPPTAAFTYTLGTGSLSYRLDLDASASKDADGTIVKYSVNFGNGVVVDKTTPDFSGFLYTAAGGYTVTLTVTDDKGATGTTSQKITVTTPTAANIAPTASFTAAVGVDSTGAASTWNILSVDASASTDPDGTIVKYDWDFGQSKYTTTSPIAGSYSYNAAGTYVVKLTVTDNLGATGTTQKSVTITAPATPPVTPPVVNPPAGAQNGDSGINQTGVAGKQQTGTGIVAYNAAGAGTFSDRVNAVGTTNLTSLPAGTFTFSNFAIDPNSGTLPNKFYFGAWVKSRGILGAGSKSTNIQMVPNTSTRSNDIPAQSTYTSNQLQYIHITSANAVIDGVKITGTEQGHLYNGLHIDGAANPTLSNSTIYHIPGNAGSPPGETFGVNFHACTGTVTVKNVTADGGGVGAAIMGSNNSGATYNITNLYTLNHPYSAGWASWEHTGTMNFYNFQCYGARAFNAERIVGVVNFYDPIWSDPKSQDLNPTYESGWSGGKINIYFSTTAAWQRFLAARTARKYVYPLTNASSVSLGVNRDTVKVFVAGVRQSGTDYIRWGGALA